MNLKDYIQENKNLFDDKKVASKVDVAFANRLKSTLHKPRKGKVFYLKYVAVAAGLTLLFMLGDSAMNTAQMAKEKTQLLTNLNDESAGTRLEGIYHFDEKYQIEDNQIINALIEILHVDSNANVKIATIDALLKFPGNEKIRTNFIRALENEKTPLVQIKLIKSLIILRENRAQIPLENIMNNQETLPIVMSNASLAIAKINNNNY